MHIEEIKKKKSFTKYIKRKGTWGDFNITETKAINYTEKRKIWRKRDW